MLLRNLSSDRLQIATPAKVNLYLELLKKRDDGFHEIETVMSTVSLYDQLVFSHNRCGRLNLKIRSTDPNAESIPTDQRNLIIRALKRLANQAANLGATDKSWGMDVVLLKRIPSSAGLGGASSNAAAALVAGNRLWKLGLNHQQLSRIASEIGSDVPFFLTGGMAMCRGRGEIIETLDAPAGLNLVIAKPQVGLSTPNVYNQCDIASSRRLSDTVTESISLGRAEKIGKSLFNRMQTAASSIAPEIPMLETAFQQLSPLGHQMSGSGSSYFGLFGDSKSAWIAAKRLAARWPSLKIHCVKSLNQGHVLTA